MRPGLFIAALICAAPAMAQEKKEPPPARKEPPPRLSKEDEEVVKELALLERMELVKNLELFEEEPRPPPQRQP